MDITYLLQVIAIILINLVVLPPLVRFADWFARRERYKPIERTWIAVAIGFFVSQATILFLTISTLIILGYGSAWWIPLSYTVLIYAITGGCQIYQQEDKRKDDAKKTQQLNDLDDIVKWQDKN